MTLAQLQATERDRILEIARRHGVTAVKVFGSFVRNEARPDSDLDLLVEAGVQTPPFFPGGLVADLEEALGQSRYRGGRGIAPSASRPYSRRGRASLNEICAAAG